MVVGGRARRKSLDLPDLYVNVMFAEVWLNTRDICPAVCLIEEEPFLSHLWSVILAGRRFLAGQLKDQCHPCKQKPEPSSREIACPLACRGPSASVSAPRFSRLRRHAHTHSGDGPEVCITCLHLQSLNTLVLQLPSSPFTGGTPQQSQLHLYIIPTPTCQLRPFMPFFCSKVATTPLQTAY